MSFSGKEPGEKEAVGGQAGERQRRDRRAWPRDGVHLASSLAGGADKLVAGVGDQRRPGIADERDGLITKPLDNPAALLLTRMVVVPPPWRCCADVREQLGRDARVFGEDQVGPP